MLHFFLHSAYVSFHVSVSIYNIVRSPDPDLDIVLEVELNFQLECSLPLTFSNVWAQANNIGDKRTNGFGNSLAVTNHLYGECVSLPPLGY